MHLIDYLREHFLTREQLLATACMAGARLDALQAAGMMPRPSYRLQVNLACDSFFGPHTESHAIDWDALTASGTPQAQKSRREAGMKAGQNRHAWRKR